MAKRNFIIVLVCLFVVSGIAGCGDKAADDSTKHEFSVAQKDFEMQGCTWNIDVPESFDVFHATGANNSKRMPIYPELGYFYTVNINIKPGENPFCNPRFLRFEFIDVHGNRYYPASNMTTIQEYANTTGLKYLSEYSDIKNEINSFILMDAPGGLMGLTLAIIYTGQNPEKKLYEVDLKR